MLSNDAAVLLRITMPTVRPARELSAWPRSSNGLFERLLHELYLGMPVV